MQFCPFCGHRAADPVKRRVPRLKTSLAPYATSAVITTHTHGVSDAVLPPVPAPHNSSPATPILAQNAGPRVAGQHRTRVRIGIAAAVLALCLFLVISVAPGHLLDDSCPAEIKRSTVLVLDLQAPLQRHAADEIVRRVAELFHRRVQQGEQVAVFNLAASRLAGMEPVLLGCKQSGIVDMLTRIADRPQSVEARTLAVVKTALANNAAPRAQAVMQTVSDLSLTGFLRSKSNNLVIFSDLLEETAGFSLSTCTDKDSVIKSFLATRAGLLARPRFSHVAMDVNVISRLGLSPLADACRKRLWNWFLGDSTDSTLTFDFLPTGAARADNNGEYVREK